MTEERASGGNAFRTDTMDLSKALGATRPVVVDLDDFGGALREWVRGDARRLHLLREIVTAHRTRVGGGHDGPALDGDGERELATDLSGFLLAKLPPIRYRGDEQPDERERVVRMWTALNTLASDHPGVFELEDDGATRLAGDRPEYDEADFWAATERQRLRRPARALDIDPDGPHLAREWDLRCMLHPRPEDRATLIPGTTAIVEVADDGSELEFLYGRTIGVPRDVRRRHVLVVGPTGCGKTTRAVLPLIRGDIADPSLTVVVLDTKGELLPAVRVFARETRPGQEVQVVQFRDPARSLGWNPLARVETHSDALELAHHLCHAVESGGGSSDSVFWINNSIDVLAAFIVALKRKHGAEASIADCLRLCDLSVPSLARFAGEFPDLQVLSRFASYVGTGSHNAETIIADLRMRLVLWRDENVAAVTSADEVDFEGLCRTPSVLVLQVPEEDVEELRPVTNAWLDQLLSTALATARVSPDLVLPVQMSVHVEEFASSVGRIPKFERRLNTVRQPGISITASVQSIWQIADEYDTAFRSVMAGFSTRIVFPGCMNEDARWFSEQAGTTTIMERTTTIEEDVREDPLALPKRIRSERPVPRPLLTPGQIQRPPANQMLGRAVTWFTPDLPPFQVFLTPLYSMVEGGAQLRAAADLGARGPLRAEALVDRPKEALGGTAIATEVGAPPSGITNTRGWPDRRIRERIDSVTEKLELPGTVGSARKWWLAFEKENEQRLALVLRLAEELRNREATITEFFLAYVYSNTDNIQANLHYLDYSRLKKEEERKKKAAAEEERERRREERAAETDRLEAHGADAVSEWDDEWCLDAESEARDDGERGAESGEAPRSREEVIRGWLKRMRDDRWTYRQAATASGLTVDTLRYWRRKLGS